MFGKLSLFSLILLISFLLSCHRKAASFPASGMDERCQLLPDKGPCLMALKRYYYDKKSGTCKEFTYGGCEGVVPFETLEECRKGCKCE